MDKKEHPCGFYPVNLLVVTVKLDGKYSWKKLRTGKHSWRGFTLCKVGFMRSKQLLAVTLYSFIGPPKPQSLPECYICRLLRSWPGHIPLDISFLLLHSPGPFKVKEGMSLSLIKMISTERVTICVFKLSRLHQLISWTNGLEVSKTMAFQEK